MAMKVYPPEFKADAVALYLSDPALAAGDRGPARLLGHGGVRAPAKVAGVSETTVRKGVFELKDGGDLLPDGRVRRLGGGRKSHRDQGPFARHRRSSSHSGKYEPDRSLGIASSIVWLLLYLGAA